MTFHYRERSPNGGLLGIFMLDRREPGQNNVYLAEVGRTAKIDGQNYLVLETGTIQRQDKGAQTPAMIVFDTYALDLNHFGAHGDGSPLKARERSTPELLAYSTTDSLCARKRGPFPRRIARTLHRAALRPGDGDDRLRRAGSAAHHKAESRRRHGRGDFLRRPAEARRLRRLGADCAEQRFRASRLSDPHIWLRAWAQPIPSGSLSSDRSGATAPHLRRPE